MVGVSYFTLRLVVLHHVALEDDRTGILFGLDELHATGACRRSPRFPNEQEERLRKIIGRHPNAPRLISYEAKKISSSNSSSETATKGSMIIVHDDEFTAKHKVFRKSQAVTQTLGL